MLSSHKLQHYVCYKLQVNTRLPTHTTMKLCVGLIILLSAIVHCNCSCSKMKKCSQCTNSRTFFHCHWCPRFGGSCHARFSFFNPCKKSDIIKQLNACPKIEVSHVTSTYNATIAKELLLLSSAVYSPTSAVLRNNPNLEVDHQKCLDEALPDAQYKITHWVTHRCTDSEATDQADECAAFLAVSESHKSLALVFRGSRNLKQVKNIASTSLFKADKQLFGPQGPPALVKSYFQEGFQNTWIGCLEQHFINLLARLPSDYMVYITGHSLGGAMAAVAATWIGQKGLVAKNRLVSYTFGSPRVGNFEFARLHDQVTSVSFRVVNYKDIIVQLPPRTHTLNSAVHHGIEIFYNSLSTFSTSPYKVCQGSGGEEDMSCSRSLGVWDLTIFDHRNYFGINVGKFWKQKCRSDIIARQISYKSSRQHCEQEL